MDKDVLKPKITTEIKTDTAGVLIVGDESCLVLPLREILFSRGVKINEEGNFSHIFQLGDFGKIEFFLAKAKAAGAKFVLIINKDINQKLAKEAEQKTLEFIETQKLEAKVIKFSGFIAEEVIPKILKVAFEFTPQRIISLTGSGIYLFAKNERQRVYWEKKKEKSPFSFQKGPLFSFILTVFLLTLPVTFILANVLLGTLALKNMKAAVFSSNFQKGKSQAVAAQQYFARAENGFKNINPFFQLLGKEETSREIEEWLATGQALGQASRHLIEVGQEGQNLALLLLGQKQGRIEELLPKVIAGIGLAEEELALIEAHTLVKPPFFGQEFEQMKTLRKRLVNLKSLLGLVPSLLGERTYLVLFQNNFELRPGGGFIGTIGLLTFHDGKMDLKIEDVYAIDGQLRGHVEAPKPLIDYLGQIHWYLRDSNWEADFPTNAQKATWFLEKELGIKADGVIAIDLALAKKILALTGPINLADYQEKVTSDNLFLKAQIYSQEGFFPGSTQKRDFLGALARALFDKLQMEKNFPWLGMVKAAEEAVEEKHLFIFMDDSLAETLVLKTGWGGEIQNVQCSISACLPDYLMVVEANLGVNKVNYFIKRQISQEVSFNQDFLTSKATIIYENTSPASISFGGPYKNYLRVFIPEKAFLESVKVDGQKLAPNQINQEKAFAKSSVGFLVEVPMGVKKTVEVSYKLYPDFPGNEFTYQLLVQKQPGTEKDPLFLTIFTPSWQILKTNFPTVVKSGGLSYNSDLSVDRLFQIRFKK